MKIKSRALRTIAVTISLALIHSAFGTAAWAQLVPRVGDVSAPVGGNSASAGSASSVGTNNSAPALTMPAASLTSPAAIFSAPQIAAAMPASAINPAASAAPAFRAAALTRSAAASVSVSAAAASAAPAAAALSRSAAASTPEQAKNAAQASAKTPSAAPAEAPAAIEAGPRTAGIGARVSRRMAELKNFFTGKSAGAAPADAAPAAALDGVEHDGAVRPTGLAPFAKPSGDKVSASGGDNAPPAPPSGPKDGGDKGKPSKAPLLGLGLAGFSIIGYMLTMQIGLEAQGVAMPQLTENAFKDFTLLPLVTVFASIGSMIGQPMSKFFTEKFGLAKTFYGAQALRAISLGAMVLMFGTGMMSMPLMMGFYFLNGIVTGVSATAEGTLRKLILADKGISQQSFRTWWQLLAESLAVPAPMIFGALVLSLGAMGAPLVTAVYPITIMLGLLLAYILKVYPLKDVKKASDAAAGAVKAADAAAKASDEKAAAAETPAPKAKESVWQRMKGTAAQIFRNMEEGKNYVMSVPYLKYSLAAAVVFDLFNVLIYRLIAPGYGKMTGGAGGLSAISGNIVGMFSLGGLLLSIVFITMENMAKKKNAGADKATLDARERSSMLRWSMAGIPALALLATMAFNVALPLAPLVFAGTNWVPSSMLAAALVPFGFLQVASSIKLNSYFQEKLPQDAGKVQKALAFSGSAMTALSIIAMLAMRPLFSAVNVFNPFPWLAAILLPAAAIGLFFLHRKLAAATKPEAIAQADEAQKQRDSEPADHRSTGYVGMILGIVAAAVVITALPMIPGVAGFLAGLGVLAKFLINLGLTIALPAIGFFATRAKPAPKK